MKRGTVEEGAAREMARRLAREEGIFGGNLLRPETSPPRCKLAQELGRGSTVATVAVDTGFKYLAGGPLSRIMNTEPRGIRNDKAMP